MLQVHHLRSEEAEAEIWQVHVLCELRIKLRDSYSM